MCRTGCRTKDCGSYAKCLRNATVQVGPMWTNSKAIGSELDAYASARKQGIQPAGTKSHQIEAAVRASEDAGKAWDAGTGGFRD
jgi:hypothetical protein